MAGEIVTKKITELEENTTIDDADILMAGDKGTNALKRFTIGAFLTAIKAKLAAWTFDTLQTTSKTLPGAVNELNSKMSYKHVSNSSLEDIISSCNTGRNIIWGQNITGIKDLTNDNDLYMDVLVYPDTSYRTAKIIVYNNRSEGIYAISILNGSWTSWKVIV